MRVVELIKKRKTNSGTGREVHLEIQGLAIGAIR
jgi:hypothetical protein